MNRRVLNFCLAFACGCALAVILQVRSAWAWTTCDPPTRAGDYVEVRQIEGAADVAAQEARWTPYLVVEIETPHLSLYGESGSPFVADFHLEEEEP